MTFSTRHESILHFLVYSPTESQQPDTSASQKSQPVFHHIRGLSLHRTLSVMRELSLAFLLDDKKFLTSWLRETRLSCLATLAFMNFLAISTTVRIFLGYDHELLGPPQWLFMADLLGSAIRNCHESVAFGTSARVFHQLSSPFSFNLLVTPHKVPILPLPLIRIMKQPLVALTSFEVYPMDEVGFGNGDDTALDGSRGRLHLCRFPGMCEKLFPA